MSKSDKASLPERRCARCGAVLPANLPPDLCPKCLLQAGLGSPPAVGPEGTVFAPHAPDSSRSLPQPGEDLGHYAIIRLLGAGGMGSVYEAEDRESGRRIALKVLGHTLNSPDARERFFREGRLAASINHPNSVYIFGTEEIGGTPVIAMELVPGGTLQDRVRAEGPLAPSEAVEAALQIIAGLEAAQQVGILHRDVKPSNCYLAEDGTVKIGDFGLSISTAVRTEPALTASGNFLGTPAFCSPEQLRGEELSARSDMYAVGATLFYLLTGRTPFEAKNVVALLATVLEQRAPSPRKLSANVPPGLASAVLRCLEKQPSDRYRSYDELRRALAPYRADAPTPATLGLRFLAGLLDILALGLTGMAALLPALGGPMNFMNLASQASPRVLWWLLAWFLVTVLYYAIPEGRWGVTLGKFICRLRVVGPNKNPPGFWRALPRPLLYVVAPVLPYWLAYGTHPRAYLDSSEPIQICMGFSPYIVMALLFCTARRRNGFAALHDLVTGTRVISGAGLEKRPWLAASDQPPAAAEVTQAIGPYRVLETLAQSRETTWLLGYDLRLLRKVWVRVVPPGTPPVPPPLRSLGRIGRLRWLTGRRGPVDNWDAFEALTGEPLLRCLRTSQPWQQVRFWLYDLASEISSTTKDGTLPVLALDRVWITSDGRAKLLDFPAPGLADNRSTHSAGMSSPQVPEPDGAMPSPAQRDHVAFQQPNSFLGAIATAALDGRTEVAPDAAPDIARPIPLHTREFLKKLPSLPDAEAVLLALKPLLRRVATVSRWRRAAIVAGCMAFPAVVLLSMMLGGSIVRRADHSYPGLTELNQLLQTRWAIHLFNRDPRGPTDRHFAIYVASHYRTLITNTASWSSGYALTMIKRDVRRFAEQSVADYPAPTTNEVAEATAALKPYLPKPETLDFTRQPAMLSGAVAAALGIYVCIPALVAALLFRGGLVLRFAGVTFVRRDGARASRFRVFWRALVAWSPLPFALIGFACVRPWLGTAGASLSAWVFVGALALVSVALPERGLPDRLAGTWPVPR